jgi:hypothetical protein
MHTGMAGYTPRVPPLVIPALVVALVGGLLLLGAAVALRRSRAQIGLARRLGGARAFKVGDLFDLDPLPSRPIRVSGRVRCSDPLVTERDERLVAFHRDVEIEVAPGSWRSIQHVRETRSFQLWDHNGSITVDPARAREPLVSIPQVWIGSPDELDETFQPAIARLAAEHGTPRRARAETRSLSVVDRLLVLAVARRDGDRPVLEPPRGGFVMSSLELDEAMRLLGGPRRHWLVPLVVAGTLGAILLVGGAATALVGALPG